MRSAPAACVGAVAIALSIWLQADPAPAYTEFEYRLYRQVIDSDLSVPESVVIARLARQHEFDSRPLRQVSGGTLVGLCLEKLRLERFREDVSP